MTELLNRVHFGHCLNSLAQLETESVHACVTSPPYFQLRDYQTDAVPWPAVTYELLPGLSPIEIPAMRASLGLETTVEAYIGHLVLVFREVRRVLRSDGTLWLNLGDSYAQSGGRGHRGEGKGNSVRDGRSNLTAQCKPGATRPPAGYKAKDLIGVPWLAGLALRADGWWLRQEIIWHKRNPTPESVNDRCTRAHEHVLLLSKSPQYHFDWAAIQEPSAEPEGPGTVRPNRSVPGERESGENANIRGSLHKIGPREMSRRRDVWSVTTQPYRDAHFAVFPAGLIEPCILAGCPAGGVVLDPFIGSGTTAEVAQRLGRSWIGCELNPSYSAMHVNRLYGKTPGLELTT